MSEQQDKTVGQYIKTLAIPLIIICLFCSFLVAFAHEGTKDTIAAKAKADTEAAYKAIFPDLGQLTQAKAPGGKIKDLQISKKDGKANGYIYTVVPNSYGGPLELMVGINAKDGKITGIKVLKHDDTPGLGAKSTEPAFSDQFKGKDTKKDIKLVKHATNKPDEFQAITAATITSSAIRDGVNEVRADYVKNYAGK